MASTENIFEELAPYAKLTVIPGVSVGQLNYVSQSDLFYTSALSITSGVVPANTQLQYFQGVLGDAATNAGYTGGILSLAQTSSRFPRGQAPANQCFVAVSAGFSVNRLDTLDLTASPTASQIVDPDDLYAIAQNFSWDLTIGRGITRTIGPLSAFCGPDNVSVIQNDAGTQVGAGADGTSGTIQLGKAGMGFNKLKVPIVFPPLVNVSITAQNGSPFKLQSAGSFKLQFRLTLRGYLMTMPVG